MNKAAFGRQYLDAVVHASTSNLYERFPTQSARRLLSPRQKSTVVTLILLGAGSFAAAPFTTLFALNAIISLTLAIVIVFRVFLTISTLSTAQKNKPDTTVLRDSDLPVVTVLLPLFDEADALILLRDAIRNLDYPTEKLDVKLILEECDQATIAEAFRLGLEHEFHIIVVPVSHPQTKPKACNHALFFARGALTVIYDAEDIPEPDQIKIAALAFANGPKDLACVQARLNFYNATENNLTRLFALEYALWFDNLLPALEKIKAPIPLGGTSNFFRTDILNALGGWDPYNVTEDADLGLRLSRKGYRTEIINSTTFEEANCDLKNWTRQRSRWLKGYMQTWLVHTRNLRAFNESVGWRESLAMHLFVAGNFFTALVYPIMWVIALAWIATGSPFISALFPAALFKLNMITLILGNFLIIFLAMIAPLKRGWTALAPYALLAPIYWFFISVAAYKGLWQLFTCPSYWEKTEHIISRHAKTRRLQAIADAPATA